MCSLGIGMCGSSRSSQFDVCQLGLIGYSLRGQEKGGRGRLPLHFLRRGGIAPLLLNSSFFYLYQFW